MSEKYFNAYVDAAVGAIHEYLSVNLHLKAQMKVANDIIAEKDGIITEKDNTISNLQNEVLALQNQSSDNDSIRENARRWEDSHRIMAEKVSHMETLLKQYNELKVQYLEKCDEIEKLKETLSAKPKEKVENNLPEKVINNKNSSKSVKSKIEKPDIDDF